MNFAYLRYVSLNKGQRTEILRPVIPIDLAGPAGEIDFYGLVDTGSDDTLIPRFLAQELGLAIDDSNRSKVKGIGEDELLISSAVVELRISDRTEFASWECQVGVMGDDEDEHDFVILGHAACLEFFTATFNGDRKTLELFPSANFPGLIGPNDNGNRN